MESDLRRALLLRLLQDSGTEFGMGTFDSRLRMQKATYLLQSMGVPLGYYYNWYKRGPYAPTLTKDLFEIELSKETVSKRARTLEIGEQSKRHLAMLRNLLTHVPSVARDQTQWYEALASVRYLEERGCSRAAVVQRLAVTKGFGQELVTAASDALDSLAR